MNRPAVPNPGTGGGIVRICVAVNSFSPPRPPADSTGSPLYRQRREGDPSMRRGRQAPRKQLQCYGSVAMSRVAQGFSVPGRLDKPIFSSY